MPRFDSVHQQYWFGAWNTYLGWQRKDLATAKVRRTPRLAAISIQSDHLRFTHNWGSLGENCKDAEMTTRIIKYVPIHLTWLGHIYFMQFDPFWIHSGTSRSQKSTVLPKRRGNFALMGPSQQYGYIIFLTSFVFLQYKYHWNFQYFIYS